jgi:hypothetical protein
MYYELGVLLNDTASDNLTRCKEWTNWTLKDLCNMWEFPQLYKTVTVTGSEYDFKRLDKLTASSVVGLVSDSASDIMVATVYGHSISSGVRTYSSEDITLTGAVTASGSTSFDFIERIEFAEALNGNVSVIANSVVKGTALIGEEVIANDFQKVIKVDSTGDVMPMTLADRKLRYTNDSSITEKIYTLNGTKLNLYGTGSATITYLRKHPLLINDYDESPVIAYGGVMVSDIVEAARLGWGLRFEDEADGLVGKQSYKAKLMEIIAELDTGGDDFKQVRLARYR